MSSVTAKSIQRSIKTLTVITMIMFALLVGLGVWVYIKQEANTRALCALRKDAENRVNASAEFLKENPNGIPGISPEQLARSTNNSVRTAKALGVVDCD